MGKVKLFSKIIANLAPWKYVGTKGIFSYYENYYSKERKVYTDLRDVDKNEEDLTADWEWIRREKNDLWR